ncbi:cell division protein FtsB [Methylonatrum kenyense]|uniref:cell division protein FtsB n=1 Tax=Methylonatrum kenyense TaxID=455253 RepID=UPI0020BD95D6|nr:cell division protein FtsB [Methylonatrum kenyense]MCK8516399.1 cell division protein FtsB [Methylonatrum kenyense]
MRALFVVLGVMFLVLQFQLWSPDGGLPQVWQLSTTLAEQEAENQALRERNEALDADVRDLKDGLEAMEERARSELGMIRDDETFYQVIER